MMESRRALYALSGFLFHRNVKRLFNDLTGMQNGDAEAPADWIAKV